MAPNTKEAKSGEMMWHTPKENPKSSGTPLARSGHTIVAANEKAYLFGGCGIEEGQAAVFQDLWILHISDQFRWEKCDAMGDVPSPRWRHTATFLPDNTTMFVFGGLCRVRSPPPLFYSPASRRFSIFFRVSPQHSEPSHSLTLTHKSSLRLPTPNRASATTSRTSST